jgi:hypothetical protein
MSLEMQNQNTNLVLGSIVIPALDSAFYSLSLKYDSQSIEHLGVVVELQKNKAKVLFPSENICLWLGKDEIMEFKNPELKDSHLSNLFKKTLLADRDLIFLMNFLSGFFELKTITGFEFGEKLKDVWNTPDFQTLPKNLEAQLWEAPRVCYLGVTVGEVFTHKIEELKSHLKNSLIYLRIIPSSLSKIEISLFLRFESKAQ